MFDIVSPSSTTVQSPSISASTPPSRLCIVASSGVAVGIRTRRIVGSAYAPPTFCIDQVWLASFIAKIPAHSNGPSPCPWWWWCAWPPIIGSAAMSNEVLAHQFVSNSTTCSPSSRWNTEITVSVGQLTGFSITFSASACAWSS